MEEAKIVQYFEGKTILITGSTGFLAKSNSLSLSRSLFLCCLFQIYLTLFISFRVIAVFLEKILRVQPNIKKLFLLIRETPKKSIQQRLHEEVRTKALDK